MVKVGDQAPDFSLPVHDGGTLALRDLNGRRVLLWFFPEADTPGWSLEGRGFRDHQQYFDDNGIVVLGASFNTPERNAAFAAKYDFGFKLLCDTTHEVAAAYGACDDIKARYPERMSFLIGADGRIERIYNRVDPRDHAAKVLVDVMGV